MQTVIDLVQRNGSQATDPATIKSWVQLVTPYQAQIWLDDRAPNRKINDHDKRVDAYAKEMANGRWRLGDPLNFDSGGKLIDGQHRLLALVKANQPVEFVILSGYERESMLVLDTGKPRLVHQSLTIAGQQCTPVQIAILNAMFTKLGGSAARAQMDRVLMVQLWEKHHEAIQFAARTYTAARLACKYAPIRAAVARAYYHVDHEALARFVYVLDGRPSEENRDRAPFLLRNQYLMQKHSAKQAPVLYSKALYAIKAFAEHRKVERLIEVKNQPYPVPDFD